MNAQSFPFTPGQKMRKKEIHSLVKGSDRHAMTSCLDGTAFLIFHDPETSKENNYDLWEGEQADGTFSYTGQGILGHQSMTRSNRGLVKAAEKELPIHFFVRPPLGVKREPGNPYQYIGQVVLEHPYFETRKAPDKAGNIRDVFVFRLIPLGNSTFKSAENSDPVGSVLCDFGEWSPIQDLASPGGESLKVPTQIDLVENKLQNRFGEYMSNLGESPERVSIKVAGSKGALVPDFILRKRGLVVEAKPTVSREHIRLAIGQVLDYRHLLAMSNELFRPAVLLPGVPQDDLVALIQSLSISLIIEREDGKFDFL